MNWQPITEKELLLQIEESILHMSEEDRLKFERIRTPISTVKCLRFNHEEHLFVLGRSGNKLLVFDDVEEDFGTVYLNPDGAVPVPLKEWNLIGLLEYALSEF